MGSVHRLRSRVEETMIETKESRFHVNDNHEMLAVRQMNQRKLWNTRRETNGLGICSLFGSQVAGSSVDLPNDDSPEPDEEEVV